MNDNNICRLCGAKTINFVGIFTDEDKNQLSSVGEMILDCLFTEITPNSGYPEIVCQFCSLQLNIFHEFRKKVFETHKNFTEELGIAVGEDIFDHKLIIRKQIENPNEENLELHENVEQEKEDTEEENEKEEGVKCKKEIEDEEEVGLLEQYEEDEPEFEINEEQNENIITDDYLNAEHKLEMNESVSELTENIPLNSIKLENNYEIDYLNDSGSYYEEEMYLDEEYISPDIMETEDNNSNITTEMYLIHNESELSEKPKDENTEQKIITIKTTTMYNDNEELHISDNNLQIDKIPNMKLKYVRQKLTKMKRQQRQHINEYCPTKGKYEFKCPYCPDKFNNKTPYHKHVRSHDIKEMCDICERPTYNLAEHRSQHENEFNCSICGKKFTTIFSCTNHERRHSEDRPLQCTACDKRFKLSSDLYNHMLCHNDIRKHICNICGKAFRMRSHLTNHLETHAVTNEFQCTFCDMTLKTSKTLRSHILQVHSNDHPYKCFYCNKGFLNKFKWRRHMRCVHSEVHEKEVEDADQVILES